jgi:hypothetical protein
MDFTSLKIDMVEFRSARATAACYFIGLMGRRNASLLLHKPKPILLHFSNQHQSEILLPPFFTGSCPAGTTISGVFTYLS